MTLLTFWFFAGDLSVSEANRCNRLVNLLSLQPQPGQQCCRQLSLDIPRADEEDENGQIGW